MSMNVRSGTAKFPLKGACFRNHRPAVILCKRNYAAQDKPKNFDRKRSSSSRFFERCRAASDRGPEVHAGQIATTSTVFWLLSQLPASAVDSTTDFSKGSFSTESYVVTLGLFLLSLPGTFTCCHSDNSQTQKLGMSASLWLVWRYTKQCTPCSLLSSYTDIKYAHLLCCALPYWITAPPTLFLANQ